MTHGDGHARVPTTRFPLTASPNLWVTSITHGSLGSNPAPPGHRGTPLGGQDWRRALPRLLRTPTPHGRQQGSRASGGQGSVAIPPAVAPGGKGKA